MLWYDALNKNNSTLSLLNSQKKLSQRLNTVKYTNAQKKKFTKYTQCYVLPNNWNLVITFNSKKNNTYINIFSPTYFFYLPIPFHKCLVKFDTVTNQLILQSLFVNSFTQTYYSITNLFFNSLLKPIFRKLKFKGKGYYIYKNYRNTITPQFGYSHRLYLYSNHTNVAFLSKTSLLIFGHNLTYIKNITNCIYSWRPINIFTGRGVRFSKQIIYRKSGKISTYR
jgi:ribosomal protein L6P/L9E